MQVIWYKFICDSRHVPVFKEVITEAFIKPINNKIVKKYRKKPVVIEAIQLTENSVRKVYEFIHGPVILKSSIDIEKWADYEQIVITKGMELKTLESDKEYQLASIGDWIIKGVQGEFYPCKPDIFEKTYEPTHNDIQ